MGGNGLLWDAVGRLKDVIRCFGFLWAAWVVAKSCGVQWTAAGCGKLLWNGVG